MTKRPAQHWVPWFVGGLLLVLAGFALWCVLLVAAVRELRAEVEAHVYLLVTIQGLQHETEQLRFGQDAAEAVPQDSWRAAVETFRETARATSEGGRLAAENQALLAQALRALEGVEARARGDERSGGSLDEQANGLLQVLHELVLRLRQRTAAISAELAGRWDSLYVLVLAALALAALNLVLTWRLHRQRQVLEAARQELALRASHDELTGLWNRRNVLEHLERELAGATRTGAPVGIVMIDLDGFKRINDELGHAAGDAVLRESARRMQQLLRASDGVGRVGGEEFLVVLPGCDEDQTLELAERLRHALSATPVEYEGRQIPITLSAGAVVFRRRDPPSSVAMLLSAADTALYRAKQEGRNRCASADAPLSAGS